MLFRLSQVSQNIPEDEPMLFIHSAFILSYFVHSIISLCSSSACQGTQRARGSQVCRLSPSGSVLPGAKKGAGLLGKRRSFQPQKLSAWAQQPKVFLKSAGVSFNSLRNQLELLTNSGKHLQSACKFNDTNDYRAKRQSFQRKEAMLMSLINAPWL